MQTAVTLVIGGILIIVFAIAFIHIEVKSFFKKLEIDYKAFDNSAEALFNIIDKGIKKLDDVENKGKHEC